MDRTLLGRALATIALAAVILTPLARRREWDDFPISSYPMFSRGDLGKRRSLAHVVLVDRDGSRRPASPALVGTPEPMVAMMMIAGSVQRGAAAELCRAVAGRARATSPPPSAVEVVTSLFDTGRYFSGAPDARAPARRDVHARCEVPP